MATTIFYVIIGILIFEYILEQILDYLNVKHFKNKLPEELKDVYDAEKYEKSQLYNQVNARFGFLTSTFSFILILLVLFFDGFAIADNFARSFSDNPIIIAMIFFGTILFISDILSTPFTIYATFVIEEKFGFNKTTIKTFISDKIKSWLLTALIGGGLLSLIIWIYQLTLNNFWIYAWIVSSGFSVFMAMFYSSLIVPLFNKQTPLENGELRNAIQEFSNKVGFRLDNIFVIDGSKRSSKANAYFSGLGPKKRIVLFDTLIKKMSVNQIVAVLAHEVGHYKKKHIRGSIIIGVLQTGLMFYILSLFISNPLLSNVLGASEHSFHLALISFGILYSPLSSLLSVFMNILSRKNEYEADAFARKHHNAEDLITSLKQLSKSSLSNLTPHPAYVFFHYSHPTLLQRINALRA